VSVPGPRVAVLDDDQVFAELMHALLEEEGYTYVALPAGSDAVEVLATHPSDVVMIGVRPAGGIDMVHRIRAHPSLATTPLLVCSTDVHELRDHAAQLASLDNVAALEKPFRIDTLTGALERLLAGAVHPQPAPRAPDADAAAELGAFLAGIGTSLRWPALDAWVPDVRPGMLRCVASWTASTRLAPFAQVSRRTLLPFGGGLPGRIWASGRAAWIEDLSDDLNFPRLRSARRAGLVSAAAVPVMDLGEIVGVVAGYDQRLRTVDKVELERLRTAAAEAGPMLRGAAGLGSPS
jgi:CheY-like chemotaxis protein